MHTFCLATKRANETWLLGCIAWDCVCVSITEAFTSSVFCKLYNISTLYVPSGLWLSCHCWPLPSEYHFVDIQWTGWWQLLPLPSLWSILVTSTSMLSMFLFRFKEILLSDCISLQFYRCVTLPSLFDVAFLLATTAASTAIVCCCTSGPVTSGDIHPLLNTD